MQGTTSRIAPPRPARMNANTVTRPQEQESHEPTLRQPAPRVPRVPANTIPSRVPRVPAGGSVKPREQSSVVQPQVYPRPAPQPGDAQSQPTIPIRTARRPVGAPLTRGPASERQAAGVPRLEGERTKEVEKEAEKVQTELGQLQRTLRQVQGRRVTEIAQKRKTISLEIDNLRGQLASQSVAATPDSSALLDKMTRLEAALALLAQEKNPIEDQETLLLKKKLDEVEEKLVEVAQKKQLATEEDRGFAMKEQLAVMEKKLLNMERRKSVIISMVLQQRMMDVEAQIRDLRVEEGGGAGKNGGKIAELEKKLEELQNTKVTPAMVNDPETVALRAQVRRLEEGVKTAERRMEEQRLKMEEERMEAWRKQQEREEEYKKAQRRREAMLLEKMAQLEKVIAQRSAPSPAPPGNAGLQKRLEELERTFQNSAPAQEKLLMEMESRLRDTEAALAKEKETSSLFVRAVTLSPSRTSDQAPSSTSKDDEISFLLQQNALLAQKLEETNQKFERELGLVISRVEGMKGISAPASSSGNKSGMSFAEINVRLSEIQAKLFDENTPEKESESLNIEYEKLISELEQTPEYQKEQEEVANKWKEENEPLNRAALNQLREKLGSMLTTERNTLLGRKPELKFLGFSPDQISKKHVNDFKSVTTQNLTEIEARALYACMPTFRKDQEKQSEFVEQLKMKIETEMKKPKVKAPPPIQPSKRVVFTKPTGEAASGGFLEELKRRRKVAY